MHTTTLIRTVRFVCSNGCDEADKNDRKLLLQQPQWFPSITTTVKAEPFMRLLKAIGRNMAAMHKMIDGNGQALHFDPAEASKDQALAESSGEGRWRLSRPVADKQQR